MASLRVFFRLLGEVPDFPDPSGPQALRDFCGEAPGPMEDGKVGAELQGDENPLPIPAAGSFFSSGCACFSILFFFLIKTCFNSCGESVGLEEKRGAHRNWSLVFFQSDGSCALLPSCNPK